MNNKEMKNETNSSRKKSKQQIKLEKKRKQTLLLSGYGQQNQFNSS